MGIFGQDWASYQSSTPDATGLSFVFLKVTEGTSYESPVWKAQYSYAKSKGLVIGFYHYPHMHNNPDAEVNYFLSKVTPKVGEMIVLDWEGYDANNRNLSKSELRAYKEEYLRFMKSKLPNNPVGLYANTDYWLNVDNDSNAGDFLWIATANKPFGQPGITAPWKFHQYKASGVDWDYGNFASKANLMAWVQSFDKTAPIGEDMTPAESKMLSELHSVLFPSAGWNYSHNDSPDVHQTLATAATFAASAAVDAKAAKADVAALGGSLNSFKADLLKAVVDTIAKSAVTATVQVNGKVV